MKDYYRVLGMPITATPSEIRSAYRKKALELHPDHNRTEGATERFIELAEAHEVLKEAIRKARYDRLKSHSSSKSSYSYTRTQRRKWREKIDIIAAKGRQRGKVYAGQSEKKLRRRWWWREHGEIILHLFEGILLVLS